MGIDYEAYYGIGAQIDIESIEARSKHGEDFREVLDGLLPKNFSYFEVGNNYTNDFIPEVYIVVKNPFENGVDGLKAKTDELQVFLIENELKYEKIDCVGGLSVT